VTFFAEPEDPWELYHRLLSHNTLCFGARELMTSSDAK